MSLWILSIFASFGYAYLLYKAQQLILHKKGAVANKVKIVYNVGELFTFAHELL